MFDKKSINIGIIVIIIVVVYFLFFKEQEGYTQTKRLGAVADYRQDKRVQKAPRVLLSEGQAVQCRANDVGAGLNTAVYRYTNGELRYYPDPTIASSWDRRWSSPVRIDCIDQIRGEDMKRK